MSEKQKLGFASAIVAITISVITFGMTFGVIPFKAGEVIKRVEVCEKEIDKIDQISSDISYIRGVLDVYITETNMR